MVSRKRKSPKKASRSRRKPGRPRGSRNKRRSPKKTTSRRKPGRPRGSRNKRRSPKKTTSRRKPGRPRGSRNKRRSPRKSPKKYKQAWRNNPAAIEETKRYYASANPGCIIIGNIYSRDKSLNKDSFKKWMNGYINFKEIYEDSPIDIRFEGTVLKNGLQVLNRIKARMNSNTDIGNLFFRCPRNRIVAY